GFTKGEADKLRKAMGKKQIDILNSLKDKFMNGGIANGLPEKTLDKIWKDWEKFAQYAFNKSHATCYAWVSYQTGWLKCHYPSEFFASCLTSAKSMDEIKKIMDDCRNHSINILGPDVNESDATFSVNKKGDVRFALSGIKGFGANVVDAMLAERKENGPFRDLYDFVERMCDYDNRKAQETLKPVSSISRKSLETLIYAGAFDSFGYKRTQFFLPCENGNVFLDELVRYSENYRNDKMNSGTSLFGDVEELKPVRPEMPAMTGEENLLALLQQEKELVGMFLSSHPLDRYAFQLEHFTNCELVRMQETIASCDESQTPKQGVRIAGIVIAKETKTQKNGKPFLKMTLEDYSGSFEVAVFGKDYEKFLPYANLHENLFIEGDIVERYFLSPEERAMGKKAPFTFRPREVNLLGNITDDFLKGFVIDLTTEILTPAFQKDLMQIVKSHPGKQPLLINLFDSTTKYRIQFHSKKFQVGVSTDLVRALHGIGIEHYEVIYKK
ncbi:MAG: hypothetical protein IKH49_01015, partial [Bacteroidales bacterium]|nr:hypothetical protein [Bacteroidales bacterium]